MIKHFPKLKKTAIAVFTAAILTLQPAGTLQGTPMGNAVTVEAASTKLTVKKKTIKVGQSYTLKLKNNKKSVKWSASNKNVTLKKKGRNSVVVTGKKKGKAVVSARIGSKKYKCTFTVKESPEISNSKVTLQVGKVYDLAVTGASSAAKWATSNKNVASIKKLSAYRYRVTAKKTGTATVTCKVAKKTLKCLVTVTKTTQNAETEKPGNTQPAVPSTPETEKPSAATPETEKPSTPVTPDKPTVIPVSSITMTPASVTLTREGQTCQLSYTINPSNTTMDKKIVWASLNPSIATVDSNGKVTAVSNGTVDIIVELCADTSKAGFCEITVAIPDDTPPNTEKVTLAGGESKICSFGPDDGLDANINLKDIVFEYSGDMNCIEVLGDDYDGELYNPRRTQYKALRAGTVQVVGKYNGETLKTWNITITSDWAVYVNYYNWKASVEAQIWNNSMTIEEKLDVLYKYIETNLQYSYTDAVEFWYVYQKPKIDCYAASALFCHMAADLGLETAYVSQTTGKLFKYYSKAKSNCPGHMYSAVYLDGQWVGYDACPPSEDAAD